MSQIYIRRMRSIRDEFYAALESIAYVIANWQRQNIRFDTAGLTPKHFEQAWRNVEATYFIRLYAEFEGILKDHLATNHTTIRVPDKPKVDWLINRVIQVESLAIESPLRAKMDTVRDYRNALAHRKKAIPAIVTFTDALSWLNTLLAKLPEPFD